MSYTTATTLATTVTLPSGYTAQVRKLRRDEGFAARAALLGHMRVVSKADGTAQLEADREPDQEAYTEKLLLAGITGWTLDGDPGDDMDEHGILRITPENLNKLTDEDAQVLVTAIQALSTTATAAEKN
jgi:hypothetical protein